MSSSKLWGWYFSPKYAPISVNPQLLPPMADTRNSDRVQFGLSEFLSSPFILLSECPLNLHPEGPISIIYNVRITSEDIYKNIMSTCPRWVVSLVRIPWGTW